MNGSLCIRGHPLLNPAGFGQVLHQPHPLIFLLLSLRGSTGAFCFLFGPITILASMASTSRSAPSPPSFFFWLRRQLLSWIRNGCFVYFGHLISSKCIVKHCLVTSIAMATTFFVIWIKTPMQIYSVITQGLLSNPQQ